MLRQLKPIDETKHNFLSLDSEDVNGITYVWCICGVYEGKTIELTFYNWQHVYKYLFCRRWANTWLVGSNLAYDLNTLIGKNGLMWKLIYNKMGGLIFGLPRDADVKKFHLQNKSIKILELNNYLAGSLKKMCDTFHIEGHMDIHTIEQACGDYAIMERACMSHARCGAQVAIRLNHEINLMGGKLKYTASSSALDLFRRKYLVEGHEIHDFKGDYKNRLKGFVNDLRIGKEAVEQARIDKMNYLKEVTGHCVIGGRTEAFRVGRFIDVMYIDVNSMYPAMMRNVMPDMNTYVRLTPCIEHFLSDTLCNYEGCALVKMRSPGLLIPLLHVMNDHKLIFPNGTVHRWYSFPEIRKALEVGYALIDVFEVARFERKHNMFNSYVNGMMEFKRQPETKQMAKLIMNGLYGKFSQQQHHDEGLMIFEGTEDEYNAVPDEDKYFSNDVAYHYVHVDDELPIEYSPHSYPLISGYTTAYSRIYLWETMEKIGFEHILYVDTDSIQADKEALEKCIASGTIEIHDDELGAWKVEHACIETEIRGPKYYRYRDLDGEDGRWQYVIKGIPNYSKPGYWRMRCVDTLRVRKLRTAIKSGKRVNEFYRIRKWDRFPEPKRIFSKRTSEAYDME